MLCTELPPVCVNSLQAVINMQITLRRLWSTCKCCVQNIRHFVLTLCRPWSTYKYCVQNFRNLCCPWSTSKCCVQNFSHFLLTLCRLWLMCKCCRNLRRWFSTNWFLSVVKPYDSCGGTGCRYVNTNTIFLLPNTRPADFLTWICYHSLLNSLAPGKFEQNFIYVIFKRILVIDGWGIACEIVLIWMSLNFTDDQWTSVQF